MSAIILKDYDWTDQEATAKGHVPGWFTTAGNAWIAHNNSSAADPEYWNDTGRQAGYLHIAEQATTADNCVLATGTADYDPRQTIPNGGDQHFVAVCVKIVSADDVFGINLSCSPNGSDYSTGNGFRLLIDPFGDGVGFFRITDGALDGGGFISAGGNLVVGERIILQGYLTHSGNDYHFRGCISTEAAPATSLTNGGLWGGLTGTSAPHVGNVAHGFGTFKTWADRWSGGVAWAKSMIGLTDAALYSGIIYADEKNTSTTQIVMKGLRPIGGTEPYTATWYRHTNVGTAHSSPASGTVISGTLNGCTDTTALPNVTYWYVRKVVDSAGSPATAYSQPVSNSLQRLATTRILLIGTSEEANAILGGPWPGGTGTPGSEDGIGGSHGNAGTFLERYLRSMLAMPVIVSTHAVSGSKWTHWANEPNLYVQDAIDYANDLAGPAVTDVLIALGENEIEAPSVLANAQSVVDQIRAAFPDLRNLFVTPPVLGIPEAITASADLQLVIDHWREVASGLTDVTIVDPYALDDFAKRQSRLLGGDGGHFAYRGAKDWGARKAKAVADHLDGTADVTVGIVQKNVGVVLR